MLTMIPIHPLFPTGLIGTSPFVSDHALLEMPFDRRLRRLRRDRAAASFAKADYLYRLAADTLIDRLGAVKRDFHNALLLGTPCSYAIEALQTRGLHVTAADPGRVFGEAAGIQCDEDNLPFASGSFDLVLAIGTLDSVNDLPGALLLIRRTLQPDGLFLAACAGAGSLPKLKSAMIAADMAQKIGASPHIHPQIDVRAAGDLLLRAGFVLSMADTDRVTIRFPDLLALVSDLRAMAATNILAARSRIPIGRAGLAAANIDFAAAAEADGKIAELFNMLYLTGWSPSFDPPASQT